MLSLGELIDKLVIENIKIFNTREKLMSSKQSKDTALLYEKMMILNDNRSVISKEIDRKLDAVTSSAEKNSILKIFKTYG